jgi:hypothetical protein
MINFIRQSGWKGLLVVLLPLCFQLDNVLGIAYIYRIMYGLIVLVAILTNNMKLYFSKKLLKVMGIIATVYIMVPLLGFNLDFEVILYGLLALLFVYVIYICGGVVAFNRKDLLFSLLISNSVVMVFQILKNLDEINQNTIMRMFDSNLYNRAYFGFSHPNFAAMFIVEEIILLYFCLKLSRHSSYYWLAILTCFVPLMATGSRTAFISILFFFVSELIFKLSPILKKYTRYVYLLGFIVGFLLIINLLGAELVSNSSGRFDQVINNINVLSKNNKILFGLGGGSTSSISSIKGINFSDNWYITCILQYGVIGLGVMLILFLRISSKVFKVSVGNESYISLLFVLAIYSIAENMLFTPGVSYSWLSWVLITSEMFPDKQSKTHKVVNAVYNKGHLEEEIK